MTTRLRKPIMLFGTTILAIQTLFMPVGMAYAETTMDTGEQEQSEAPIFPSLLETTEENDSQFLFKQSHVQGTVNDPINVTISSKQEVSEVRVRLPEATQVLNEQLPAGILMEQDKNSKEWVIQAHRPQNTFVLPLVFESEGNYELSVKDVTATVEISNEEDPTGEELLESSSSEDIKDSILEETNISEEAPGTKSSTNVSTWAQYAAAINNQNVTTINVMGNISGNTNLNTINRNLTINGNGYTINSQGQQYNVTGDNRQITVRNATITGTVTGKAAQFRSASGASNTRFIFSGITFRGLNRFLGPDSSVGNIGISLVVFDGGNSYFPNMNSTNSLFVNVPDFRITNQASVEVDGRRLTAYTTGTSIELAKTMTFSVEAGSSLSVLNSSNNAIVADTINIDGKLNASTVGFPLTNGGIATLSSKINFGNYSQIKLERTGGIGGIISMNGGELSIAKGAQFDFINQNNGPVISAGTNPTSVNIESDCLALWDLGLQNEEKASMVFSDIALQAAGANGSEIISTNNERFQRLYDPAGLASYSRMSNRDVEEMDRFVKVHFESEDGTTLENSETITGFLGDLYEVASKEIPGYQLIAVPENALGEFTREMIEVTYVYKKTSITPVDPLDPEKEVDPENPPILPEEQGLFSIDFASQFDFGVQAISAQDQTYYAKPQRLLVEDGTVLEGEVRPNYVQISDRRPTQERDGWELSVRQNDQFTDRATGQELRGARLVLQKQQIATAQGGTAPGLAHTNPMTLNPGGAKRTLLKAQGPEGEGTWIYRFGDAESADKSVVLEVPRGATPSTASYQTTLTWELSSVPDN